MLRVGLTGGIGSGKSTLAGLLAARGAAVVDADAIAREVVEPGTPALDALAARFGSAILTADGRLDRAGLAALVFTDPPDPAALADLNAITHPAIFSTMLERAASYEGTDRVVVLDVALIDAAAIDRYSLDVVVVVDVPEDVAVARLVEHRGFSEADARARIATQIGREERRSFADLVVDNRAGPAELAAEADRVWAELARRGV